MITLRLYVGMSYVPLLARPAGRAIPDQTADYCWWLTYTDTHITRSVRFNTASHKRKQQRRSYAYLTECRYINTPVDVYACVCMCLLLRFFCPLLFPHLIQWSHFYSIYPNPWQYDLRSANIRIYEHKCTSICKHLPTHVFRLTYRRVCWVNNAYWVFIPFSTHLSVCVVIG